MKKPIKFLTRLRLLVATMASFFLLMIVPLNGQTVSQMGLNMNAVKRAEIKRTAIQGVKELPTITTMDRAMRRQKPGLRRGSMFRYRRAFRALKALERADKMSEKQLEIQVYTFNKNMLDFLDYTIGDDSVNGCCIDEGRGCQDDCREEVNSGAKSKAICGCILEAGICLACRIRGGQCCQSTD